MAKNQNNIPEEQMEIFGNFIPQPPIIGEARKVAEIEGKGYTQHDLAKIIDGLLEHIEQLNMKAFTDVRTGYLNVTAFDTALRDIAKNNLEKIEKNEEPEHVTVAMLDLNYLKTINNQSQKGCGDVAIKYLSNYISQHLRTQENSTKNNNKRSVDTIAGSNETKDQDLILHKPEKSQLPLPSDNLFARYSAGDEFVIIMRNCSKKQAEIRLQNMLNQMAHDSLHGDERGDNKCIGTDDRGRKTPIQVSAAFGCAEIPKISLEQINKKDRNYLVDKMVNDTLAEANRLEGINKKHSKVFASQIKNGNPAVGPRQDAEKIVGDHIGRLIHEENTFTTKLGNTYTLHDIHQRKILFTDRIKDTKRNNQSQIST